MDLSLFGAIMLSMLILGILASLGITVWVVFKHIPRSFYSSKRTHNHQMDPAAYTDADEGEDDSDEAELANIKAKIIQSRLTAQATASELRSVLEHDNPSLDAETIIKLRLLSSEIDYIAKHNEAVEAVILRCLNS